MESSHVSFNDHTPETRRQSEDHLNNNRRQSAKSIHSMKSYNRRQSAKSIHSVKSLKSAKSMKSRNLIDDIDEGYLPDFESERCTPEGSSGHHGDESLHGDVEDEVYEILTHTPLKPSEFITMEDTFWPGKKFMIPDYSVMEEMDDHAIRVSIHMINITSLWSQNKV